MNPDQDPGHPQSFWPTFCEQDRDGGTAGSHFLPWGKEGSSKPKQIEKELNPEEYKADPGTVAAESSPPFCETSPKAVL